MDISAHARARQQQRAISHDAVQALLAYGECRRRGGADVFFLTKKSRSRIIAAMGKDHSSRLERSLDCYLVVSDDGCLVTAAHRQRRLKF